MTLNIAHQRAAAAGPGETLTLFEQAVAAGADVIEFDVRFTRDGQLVVWHGDTLDGAAGGHGSVYTYTLGELQQMSVLSLDDALTWAGPRVPVLIDLPAGNPQSAVDVVAEVIAARGLYDRVTIISPDFGFVLRAKLCDRRLRVACKLARLWQVQALTFPGKAHYLDGVLPRHDLVTGALVDQFFSLGWFVYPYTVTDPAEMRRLCGLSVQGILTDTPDLLAQQLVPSR